MKCGIIKQMLQSLAVTVTLIALLQAAASAGTLRYWNSASNPLIVKNESGNDAGAGYGNWRVETTSVGTESRAFGYLKDLRANGNNVYFKLETWTNAGYCISPDYVSCTAEYYYYREEFSGGNKETWNQNYWSPKYLAATLVNPSADYARPHMFVQESNDFGDPYAGPTITKGNAY